MAQNIVRQLNPTRIRSWFHRLPLFTRAIVLLILGVWGASFILPWILTAGALVPAEVGLMSMHSLNTYPVVHSGTIQLAFTLTALTPLLERFEAEHGTLISLAMFFGPFSTFPGLLYIFLDHFLLRSNHPVQGARQVYETNTSRIEADSTCSVWVFLLFACESVKQYKTNPSFTLGPYKIPTWTSTIVVILVINFLIPNTSLLAHLCGAIVGYIFELGYLQLLVPPERGLRWVEGKLNLLGRLPHYVSVDAKIFGRYGVLDPKTPSETTAPPLSFMASASHPATE